MRKNFTSLLTALMFAFLLLTAQSSCTTDKCSEVSCQNLGTCDDGKCNCADGYEGSECQTRANAKFVGQYLGSDDCSGLLGTVSAVDIDAISAGARYITVSYVYDEETFDVEVEGTVTDNNISISQKPITLDGQAATYSATGSLNGNQLTLNATIDVDGDVYNCIFTGNK